MRRRKAPFFLFIDPMRKSLMLLAFLLAAAGLRAQAYLSLGLDGAIFKPEVANGIFENYNQQNLLWLRTRFAPISSTGGIWAGGGLWSERTLVELRYGSQRVTRLSDGFQPGGNFTERNVRFSYRHIGLSLGIRPFEETYLALGLSANGGNVRTLVAQSSNFSVLTSTFTFSSDIFADFSVYRNGPFQFRLRPYFRLFFTPVSLTPLDDWLNESQSSGEGLSQPFNHGGFQFSLNYLLE